MNSNNEVSVSGFPLWKKYLFSFVVLLLMFFVAELAFRIFFALNVGPSVLLFGAHFHHKQHGPELAEENSAGQANWKTLKASVPGDKMNSRTVGEHASTHEGYMKYFPHQKSIDFDVETGESFNVTINSNGFRGKDFELEKSLV